VIGEVGRWGKRLKVKGKSEKEKKGINLIFHLFPVGELVEPLPLSLSPYRLI